MGMRGSLGGASLGGSLFGTGVHKYDTGLFRAQRSVVRQGIADALKPMLLPALGGGPNGYVRAIRAIPRPLHTDHDDEMNWLVNAVQGQAPCIVIALGRKDYEAAGMNIPSVNYVAKLEVAIYAVSGNVRAYVEGRLSTDVGGTASANADPGIETMLEHIEELLIGQELDIITLHEPRPQSEDEVYTGGDFSIWEQRYAMKVERSLDPERGILNPATSIEALTTIDGNAPGTPPANPPAAPLVETITTLGVP